MFFNPGFKRDWLQRLAAENHNTQIERGISPGFILNRNQLSECRRSLIQHGNALIDHEAIKQSGIAAHIVGHDNESTACG